MSTLRIAGGEITLPTGLIKNVTIASDAAIDTTKVKQMYKKGTNFNTAIGSAPTNREEIVHVCNSSGTLKGFHAILNVTGSTTDIDFDIKINGVSALSALLNFTNTDSDAVPKDGSLSTTAVTVDDVISIEVAVTTSTGAQGAYAWVDIEEDNAPT